MITNTPLIRTITEIEFDDYRSAYKEECSELPSDLKISQANNTEFFAIRFKCYYRIELHSQFIGQACDILKKDRYHAIKKEIDLAANYKQIAKLNKDYSKSYKTPLVGDFVEFVNGQIRMIGRINFERSRLNYTDPACVGLLHEYGEAENSKPSDYANIDIEDLELSDRTIKAEFYLVNSVGDKPIIDFDRRVWLYDGVVALKDFSAPLIEQERIF